MTKEEIEKLGRINKWIRQKAKRYGFAKMNNDLYYLKNDLIFRCSFDIRPQSDNFTSTVSVRFKPFCCDRLLSEITGAYAPNGLSDYLSQDNLAPWYSFASYSFSHIVADDDSIDVFFKDLLLRIDDICGKYTDIDSFLSDVKKDPGMALTTMLCYLEKNDRKEAMAVFDWIEKDDLLSYSKYMSALLRGRISEYFSK